MWQNVKLEILSLIECMLFDNYYCVQICYLFLCRVLSKCEELHLLLSLLNLNINCALDRQTFQIHKLSSDHLK